MGACETCAFREGDCLLGHTCCEHCDAACEAVTAALSDRDALLAAVLGEVRLITCTFETFLDALQGSLNRIREVACCAFKDADVASPSGCGAVATGLDACGRCSDCGAADDCGGTEDDDLVQLQRGCCCGTADGGDGCGG